MRRQAFLLLAAIGLAALILMPSAPFVRYVLAFVFLWVLPGLSWAELIDGRTLGRAEQLAVGLGLSYVIVPIATLLSMFLPGPLTRAHLLSILTGTTALPLAGSFLKHMREGHRDRATGSPNVLAPPLSWGRWLWHDGWVWLLAALLIGGALRLVHLNYSEFQGDEATVLVRAARALEGDKEVTLLHTKGPAELTIVMASWRLAGALNEWMARLPFAWASMLGLVATFLCGRRLGHPHGAGIAVCLLAINGYFIAFGRIVQYQSVVFALTTLGILCLLAYHAQGPGSLVGVAAALFAGGLLAPHS